MCDIMNITKSRCANCNRDLDPKMDETEVCKINVNLKISPSSQQPSENPSSAPNLQELSVYEALSTVYNFKSFDEYENRHGHGGKCQKDMDPIMCKSCSVILSDLYEKYKELDLVRQVGSYMTQKLERLEQHIIHNFHASPVSTCQKNNKSDSTIETNCNLQDETDMLVVDVDPEGLVDDDDDDEPEIIAVKPGVDSDIEEISDGEKDDPLSMDLPTTTTVATISSKLPIKGPAVRKRIIIVRRVASNKNNKNLLRSRPQPLAIEYNLPQKQPPISKNNMMPPTSLRRKIATISSNTIASGRSTSGQPTTTPPSSSSDDRLNKNSGEKDVDSGDVSCSPYKCKKCVHPTRFFRSDPLLLQHMKNPGPKGHNKKPKSCDCAPCEMDKFLGVVSTYFMNAGDYKDACDRGESIKSYKLWTFKLQETSAHVILTKPAPYTCPFDECGIVYKDLKLFLDHLRTVHLLQCTTCPKCSRKFTNKRKLSVHLKKCGLPLKVGRKRIYETPFNCDVCNKEFPNKCGYERHIVKHKTEKDVQCEVCGKGFKSVTHLRGHMLVHSDLRPAMCPQCGKTYKSKSQLSFHERIAHTEEGRLKFNAYTRMKNRRRKLREQQQRQQQQGKEAQQEEEEEDQTEGIEDDGHLPLEHNLFPNISFSELV